MSTGKLNIIANHIDIDDRLVECTECDGRGEVRVRDGTLSTGAGPNACIPNLIDKPCPEDCDDGWITWREYGGREGAESLVDLAEVLDVIDGQRANRILDELEVAA